MNRNSDEARRWFADDLRESAPVCQNLRIVDAFAHVPRENYLGAGPWRIHSRRNIGDTHLSASAEPHHLYHDLLVSIDDASGINNGLPSLWARVFDNLDLRPGTRVLQVGAGVGYYTAILAELVTDRGSVTAYEIESDLALRAQRNLQSYPHVRVISGSAVDVPELPELDAVTVCAGATHVPMPWLGALADGGQMVIPMTGEDGWGFLMHLERDGSRFPVRSLGPCGFYPCAGARSDSEAASLSKVLDADPEATQSLGFCHGGEPPSDADAVWIVGDGFWISKSNGA